MRPGAFISTRRSLTVPTSRVEDEHTPDAIRARLAAGPTGSRLRDPGQVPPLAIHEHHR
jgi:hypothetical protein